jgi:surface protein
MGGLFRGCKSLLSLPDISKWKIKNVTNLEYLFSFCESLSSLPDISKWKKIM